jgi:DNA-binding SARP family transcriptional activator
MAPATQQTPRPPGCLLVVAAAGYGKTTALETDGPAAYYAAADLVGSLPDITTACLAVDDLDRLASRDQVRLLRALSDLNGPTRISLATRRPLGAAATAALPNPLTERGPSDLVVAPDALAQVLRDEHCVADPELAYLVHDLTAGWPALVHLAGDALGRLGAGRHDLLAALTEPGTAGAAWVREQALAGLPPYAARLLDLTAQLDPITTSLCAALSTDDPQRTADAVWWLTRTGILVPHRRQPYGRPEAALRLVPVLAAVLARQRRPARRPVEAQTAGNRLHAAASWYAANGYPLASARTLAAAGDSRRCAAVIAERGDEMLASGGAIEVSRVIEALPAAERTPRVRLVLGDALRMAGDVAGAQRAFAPLLEGAGRTGRCEPRVAWRAAMLHYMRADYRGALDLLDRAMPAAQAPTVDDVLLEACRASALLHMGATDDAAASAARAVAVAAATADDRASAAAYIAAALTEVGTRRDERLASALAAAERADDVVQQARILTNQADCRLREARYPQALEVAVRAVRAAELGGPPGLLMTALHNAGEALTRLGRYDEATLHFERSIRIGHRVGLNRIAAGLYGLADVDRQLGRREQSRTRFEEAADLARATAEVQILVPALAGLARLLLDGPAADPAAARAAADEAERVAPPTLASRALVACGWVALADGDLALAQRRAADAAHAARAGRQADTLAESLELAAGVSAEAGPARAALQEAAAIWDRAGALPAADQMRVLLGQLPGADSSQRLAARTAARRLLGLGVRTVNGSPLLPAEGTAATVQVRVLGRFEVLVAGRPVPLPAWRSRQARTLLKILVARRGRPVPRTELCELLWPDDEPQRTAHRLSVLLSVVRTVLDPMRLWAPDHYLAADLTGVSLDVSRVTVDVEDLLRDTAHGMQLAREGDPAQAREILAEVDAAYRGNAFDDEPYEDWADGLREQARSVWLRALRELADLGRSARDPEQAVTCLVRLLAADPFDESAHHALVRVLVEAGRYGEARRTFDRWAAAMRSIDAPPPDPGVLRGLSAQQAEKSMK